MGFFLEFIVKSKACSSHSIAFNISCSLHTVGDSIKISSAYSVRQSEKRSTWAINIKRSCFIISSIRERKREKRVNEWTRRMQQRWSLTTSTRRLIVVTAGWLRRGNVPWNPQNGRFYSFCHLDDNWCFFAAGTDAASMTHCRILCRSIDRIFKLISFLL